MGTSIRLGKILGISIGINYSWFLIFLLIALSLSQQFHDLYPRWSPLERWSVVILASLLFFASVLAHELTHSLVAIKKGIPVKGITLFLFGGVAQISKEAPSPGIEFKIAVVGPLSSIALGLLFWVLYLISRPFSQHIAAIFLFLFPINLLLGVFNLIPGFPLDGGRVFRAALWHYSKNYKLATRWATWTGQAVAIAFIAGGIVIALKGNFLQGVWLAFIGWFLESAAASSYRQFQLRETLLGFSARDVMTTECPAISRNITLQELVDEHVLPQAQRCFMVFQEGTFRGLITLSTVKAVPRERWSSTTVWEAMVPLDRLIWVSPDEDAYSVLEKMDDRDINQVPVVEGGQAVGLIARDKVLKFVRTRLELGRF